ESLTQNFAVLRQMARFGRFAISIAKKAARVSHVTPGFAQVQLFSPPTGWRASLLSKSDSKKMRKRGSQASSIGEGEAFGHLHEARWRRGRCHTWNRAAAGAP